MICEYVYILSVILSVSSRLADGDVKYTRHFSVTLKLTVIVEKSSYRGILLESVSQFLGLKKNVLTQSFFFFLIRHVFVDYANIAQGLEGKCSMPAMYYVC